MKQLTAFLQPHRLSRVVRAVHDAPRFPGFTVLEAHGQGHGRGAGGQYAPGSDDLLYHARVVLVVVCDDEEAAPLAELIARAARTGNNGDGIVAIAPLDAVLRIRDAQPLAEPNA